MFKLYVGVQKFLHFRLNQILILFHQINKDDIEMLILIKTMRIHMKHILPDMGFCF